MLAKCVRSGKCGWFALVFLLLISSSLSVQFAPALDPPHDPVPRRYFGLHIHHLWQDTEWPSIDFGTWRLWDAHVMWSYLEPHPGVYDFSLLDKYVQVAQDHDVDLVMTLDGTPTWASARPLEVPMHLGGVRGAAGLAAEPQSLSSWNDFVRTVATRYKGKIHYYEIWNEPMSQPFFTGSPQTMVGIVKSASAVLKQVDPSIKVLSPPVSGDDKGLSWLESFLRAGGGQYVDIYGFHFYVGGEPEKGLSKVENARLMLRQFGQDSKPMWNTEAGWQVSQLGPQVSSQYVARALLLGWPAGLGRYIYYSWDHPQMGIAPNGNMSTPMVRAYGTIEQWMQGAVVTRCVSLPNGLWVENLTMANGLAAKVVWSPGGPMPLSRDNVGNANMYKTLDGQTVPIPANATLQVGESPILLYADGQPR